MDAGFGVLGSLLEEDRAELCGERYARSQQRRAYRHGYDEGSLVMGGRRVKVRKPRARSVDGQELPLPHWERFKATDPLEERAEQILCGVTTRKYERSLEARRRASFVGNESLECVAAVRSAYSQAGAAVPGPTAQ